jgi:hypothetical protein
VTEAVLYSSSFCAPITLPTAAPRAKCTHSAALSTGMHAPHRLSGQACSPRSLTCSTTLIMCADVVRVGEVDFPVDDMTNVTPNILAKVCIAGSHSALTSAALASANATARCVSFSSIIQLCFQWPQLQSLVFFFIAVLARLSLHTQTSCVSVCAQTSTIQLGMTRLGV